MAPKKKQKTEEGEVATAGEGETVEAVDEVHMDVKADEKAELALNETEKDAAQDHKPRIKKPVQFLTADTTPNVLPAAGVNMLLASKDNGLNHLCSGARGSVGVKSGRYAFEVKVVETFGDAAAGTKPGAIPKCVLRVGFSTKGSGLLLGNGKDNICFDEAGALVFDKGPVVPAGIAKKNALMFSNHASVVIVLNLDAKSSNANTISLFHDGKRVSAPQPLPDSLKGQALFPTVTFRSLTVHTNFDGDAGLPFKCRMLGDITANVADVTDDSPEALEVVFPVFLPDKGTFDWLDWFLKEKEGRYSELSDRAILDWGLKSGLKNTKGLNKKSSADKPEMGFNVAGLDDGSVKELLVALSPLQNRSYVVMEVKGNLLKEERVAALKKWRYGPYKKVAQVMMGIPEEGFRTKVLESLLADKQAKLDKEFEAQQLQKAKRKVAAKIQKQNQAAMKKAAKIRKKMEAEKQKKKEEDEKKAKEAAEKAAAEAAEKEAAGEEDKEGEEGAEKETKDEEMKEEEKAPEEKAQETKEEVEDSDEEEVEKSDDEPEAAAPVATLSPVELQTWFRKLPQPDLNETVVAAIFNKASLPDESEGFDEVRYTWSGLELSEDELKRWVTERKLTSKIEDLTPSAWFKEKWEAWQKDLQAWHVKHMEHKDPSKKKLDALGNPYAKATSPAKPAAKDDINSAEVEDDDKDPIAALEEELDREEMDIFGLENINDVDKEGTPLFANFAFEDWALLSLRFELHLLVHSFRHDANDPERTGIHPEHLAFYYNRYYKKALNAKNYGVDTVDDLIDLVKDTALADSKSKVVESMVGEDLESNDIFVKLTEENRRDRHRRVDAGDDTAKLKFSRPASGPGGGGMAAAAPPAGGSQNYGGTSKAGGLGGMRPPGPVGGGALGQKAKASGGPDFAPKQQAWGSQMGKGQMRPQMGGMQPQGKGAWGGNNMGGGAQRPVGRAGMSSMMGGMGQWGGGGGLFGGGNQWGGGW